MSLRRCLQALLLHMLLTWLAATASAEQVVMPVSFDEVLAAPSAPHSGQFAYGAAQSQYARLWRAPVAQEPAPVMVLVHGGCWLQAYDVAHIAPLASALAAAGFAVWAPEYRRLGESGGGWPGSAEDVLVAIQALRELGPAHVDLQRVVLAGHSAGGQLALWASAALPGDGEAGLRVRGVIGLAAITDLHDYAAGNNSCQQAAVRFLGGRPDQVPAHYAAASPRELTLPQATILLHGDVDSIVPLAQAQAITAAETRVVEGAGHFDLIHPGTAAFPALVRALNDVLEQP